MKKQIFILFILTFKCCIFTVNAQGYVSLEFIDGIYDKALKAKMETSASVLLTEINKAYNEDRALNLVGKDITQDAEMGLLALWENTHFYCDDSEVVQSCISTKNGYQVRQIPLRIKPIGETLEDDYQEAVINFDRNGKIIRFNFTLSTAIYQNVIKEGKDVTEIARRQEILSYVERFRTAYNEKDIKFLEQIFSEDAIIITGNVIKTKKNDGSVRLNEVRYSEQDKEQYLSNLRRSFKSNSWINVKFDEIQVSPHNNKIYKGFYGVTLHQLYSNSNGYSDDGYLFMMWDFRDRDNVQIHIRTWQPKWLNEDKTQELPEAGIFTAEEFVIKL